MEEDPAKAAAFAAALAAAGTAAVTVADGRALTVTKDMVKVAVERRRVGERKYVPNVIEPSFGIGRIITGVLEHNFSVRPGAEQRAVLSFRPAVAPYKAVVLPLDARIPKETVRALSAALTAAGLSCTVDDGGASVGKRYSRADEVGVPFGVTVDFDSAKDGAATIRERDSCAQIRVPLPAIPSLLRQLCDEELTWAEAMARHTVVTTGEDKAATAVAATAAAGAGVVTTAAPTAVAAAAPSAPAAAAAAAAAAPSAATSTAAAAAAPAPSSGLAPAPSGHGTSGVALEGGARSYGRFFRPADL